jgi:hypothetical protein
MPSAAFNRFKIANWKGRENVEENHGRKAALELAAAKEPRLRMLHWDRRAKVWAVVLPGTDADCTSVIRKYSLVQSVVAK